MSNEELINLCRTEEQRGIRERSAMPEDRRDFENLLPWSYPARVKEFLKDGTRVLDMSIASGGILINHPFELISVIEGMGDSETVKRLATMGIRVNGCGEPGVIPYDDGSFDLVISRHEKYDLSEINRVLRKGGHFITEQIGGENAGELLRLISASCGASAYNLENQTVEFKKAGFKVVFRNQDYPVLRFETVPELCRFAGSCPEDAGYFSVDAYAEKLSDIAKLIEDRGFFEITGHRFIIVAKKL